MPKVVMYSTELCPYCRMAERLLLARGVATIEKVCVDRDSERLFEMIAKTGRRTVPQVFVGGHHVGGFDDLLALDRRGKLDALLEV